MTNQIKNLKNKCCYGNDKCPTCIGKHKFNDWNVCDYCQCHLGIDCEDFCKKDNNLKNFIKEGEKEFDEVVNHFTDEQTIFHTKKCRGNLHDRNCPTIIIKKHLKPFISSRQISLIKMIVEMVESEKETIKCNNTHRIARDTGGFGICWKCSADGGFNQALDTISSKLKELIKE